MNVSQIQNRKAITHEVLAQTAAHLHVENPSGPTHMSMAMNLQPRPGITPEPAAGNWLSESVSRVDVMKLIAVLRQLEGFAKRQPPRIAFKSNGRILFLDLTEILAVQAEGNYVSLRHRPNTYLLRESLSSMAEKLRPYGFVRIHRSVVVNMSAVEQIQPLPTGEYRLHVRGGKEYLVTRTYKDNLKDLAQLWVGSERFCE